MFIYFKFHETPLYKAIEKDNLEIVKLLLAHEKLNVNLKTIHNLNVFKQNFLSNR